MPTIRLHDFELSGHCHRVRLLLALLGQPYERLPVALASGAHKRPDFLARNVFGQVPVIEDGGLTLADSNAILVYLALTYDPSRRWLPESPAAQAQVQRWLSVAAGPLAQGPAAARAAALFGKPGGDAAPVVARQLFATMDAHLDGRDWLATEQATLADVAMYSYTAHAPEGGISLEPYGRLLAWVARVEALPGFVGMPSAARPKP